MSRKCYKIILYLFVHRCRSTAQESDYGYSVHSLSFDASDGFVWYWGTSESDRLYDGSCEHSPPYMVIFPLL